MTTAARILTRHCRDVAQTAASMLSPTKTALELAVRCKMTLMDIHLPIPSVFLADMFPEKPPDPANVIKLMPGTALNGAPNIFEQFILCALVKKIQPQTILEIGTFKGATTWHLFENAPPDATIYTLDLPDDEIPTDVSNVDVAAIKSRPFLPDSDRVRQILINSRKWDGVLDRKVQFAFIDADHRYEGIRNDTEKTLPLLDSYACICWHDALEKGYGYGTVPYLLELRKKGLKIFRLRSVHEISSIAIWMSEPMLERLRVPTPRSDALLSKYYTGVEWYDRPQNAVGV
jgi:predicted O-methyltransferase YrrM